MKLSDFKGQEHITSVLRAMVMKNDVRPVAFLGDIELSKKIASAYIQSMNCANPQFGNACDACKYCVNKFYDGGVLISFGTVPDGYLAFETKTALGAQINKFVLVHLIFSWQGSKDLAVNQAKEIAENQTLAQFIEEYLEIFKNIMYLKNGMEIVETAKLEPLSQLAARIPMNTVMAGMRLLWDAQNKSSLSDSLAVEIVAALLSEAVKPSPVIEYQQISSNNETAPINMVDNTIEQPLDVEKMLAIANE